MAIKIIKLKDVVLKKNNSEYKLQLGENTHTLDISQSYRLNHWLSIWLDSPMVTFLVNSIR